MDIELIELMENSARFIISGADPETVNALRRALISEVPKLAIETVDFHLGPIIDEEGRDYESVSPLFDEVIAHRLGLVPIPTDLEAFTFKDQCSCGGVGCPSCTVMYSLNKKGPCEVYSGDLEPLGSEEFRVKDELIPIVKLGEGQAILVYASAELGTAKRHAKWQATSGVGYRYLPTVKIDPELCDSEGDCVKVCPKRVFEQQGDKTVVADPLACDLCRACVRACESAAITVEGDETRFIFQFETDSSLTAEQALVKALEILENKYEDFRDKVSSLES